MDYVKAARTGAKLAVKYGPQAKLAWDRGGRQAATAAQKRALALVARRKAFAEAETVRAGSVLKRVVEGSAVYVVLSGDQPVRAYPPQQAPLETLLTHADLARRETVQEHRDRQLRTRAKRLRARTRGSQESNPSTEGGLIEP